MARVRPTDQPGSSQCVLNDPVFALKRILCRSARALFAVDPNLSADRLLRLDQKSVSQTQSLFPPYLQLADSPPLPAPVSAPSQRSGLDCPRVRWSRGTGNLLLAASGKPKKVGQWHLFGRADPERSSSSAAPEHQFRPHDRHFVPRQPRPKRKIAGMANDRGSRRQISGRLRNQTWNQSVPDRQRISDVIAALLLFKGQTQRRTRPSSGLYPGIPGHPERVLFLAAV